MPKSPTIRSRLAAAYMLCGHGKSWHRTWVPRLWDQGSQSDDPLRSAETAPLPGRRRDHRAVLTIDGLLQGNRYKAGLRSNHPYIAHRSSRCRRPMPVTLVDHRFRGSPCRVAQSATCTSRRVHRSYPLRRPVHLVPIPAMESVLPAEPEPIQRVFEDGLLRLPFKAPSAQRLIRQSKDSQRVQRFAVIEADSPPGRGRDRFWSTTYHLRRACDVSAPNGRGYCMTPRGSSGWLASQSFEFRNQMLECFEIADCCHRPDVQAIEHGDELCIANRLGQGLHLADSP